MGDEGGGKEIIKRCMTDEGLLKTELLEDVPDDHRPEDEYIAARLKVPHEFRMRMLSKTERKAKRKRARGYQKAGDEIWMHVKTDEDDVMAWRQHMKPPANGNAKKEAEEEPSACGEIETNNQNGHVDQTDGEWLGRPPPLK